MVLTGPTPTDKLSLVSETHKVSWKYCLLSHRFEVRPYLCTTRTRWEWSNIHNIILVMFSSAHVDTSSLPVEQPHSFQINFNSLYTALCEQQRSDQATLLLYTLLHQNTNMRTYMLSRTDMDNLVGRTSVKDSCGMQMCAHSLFLSQSDVLSVVYGQNKSKENC